MKKLYRFLLKQLPKEKALHIRHFLIRLSTVFGWFAPLVFFGNKVECTVCSHSFRKFLTYGATNRPNVLCPRCRSIERHRLTNLYLREKTPFYSAPLRVLHIAPEHCFFRRFRKIRNLDYVTADLASPLADVKMDLHHAPLSDNEFDVILCNHVLEHVEDDAQCMRELYRILKPGGFAILQVPIDETRRTTYEDPSITSPEERAIHFRQRDHVRLYGMDYPDRLAKAGFRVECNDLATQLGEKAQRYRVIPDEILYIGRKG